MARDGSTVMNFPLEAGAAAYPALGQLSTTASGFEIVAGIRKSSAPNLYALDGAGAALPGFPKTTANFIESPPALADVDGDGLDEIFTEEEDGKLHAYNVDGSVLSGWPQTGTGGQEFHTPAIGDLDGDNIPEIVAVTGASTPTLYAFHADGSVLSGFPIAFSNGLVDIYPVIGDVDGDSQREIVLVNREGISPYRRFVFVYAGNGTLKRSMQVSGDIFYGTQPALADLDGDHVPEIIVQSNSALDVWKGNGTVYPGFPFGFTGGTYWLGNSAPVVGDVDGEGQPDIAVTTQIAGSAEDGKLWLIKRDGTVHSHFPKSLKIGAGAVPAIEDLDLDGRNELIVSGAYANLQAGYYNKVWAYDLKGENYGGIEWGQFGGGPQHRGSYESNTAPATPTPTATVTISPLPSATPTATPTLCSPASPLAPPNNAHLKKTRVLLKWSANPCATHYKYQVRVGAVSSPNFVKKKVATTQYALDGLARKLWYYWRVRGCNAASCEAWTAWQSFIIDR